MRGGFCFLVRLVVANAKKWMEKALMSTGERIVGVLVRGHCLNHPEKSSIGSIKLGTIIT